MAQWSENLLDAEFAGFPLVLLNTRDEEPRRLGTHTYINSDGSSSRDRGGAQRRTSCEIVFFRNTLDDRDPIERFLEFRAIVQSGEVGEFVHPITGVYNALPSDFSHSAAASPVDRIQVSLTFVEVIDEELERVVRKVTDRGGGATITAGVELTRQANFSYQNYLDSIGVTSTTGTDALLQAEAWELDQLTTTARQVNLELNKVTNDISTEVERLEVLADIDRQPLLRSLQEIHSAIRQCADSAIAESKRLTELTVTADAPLLAIVADFYGASNSIERALQVVELNDIPNPALVPAGTVLTVRAA